LQQPCLCDEKLAVGNVSALVQSHQLSYLFFQVARRRGAAREAGARTGIRA